MSLIKELYLYNHGRLPKQLVIGGNLHAMCSLLWYGATSACIILEEEITELYVMETQRCQALPIVAHVYVN